MQSQVVIETPDESKLESNNAEGGYSLLKDSKLAKYSGNTATLFSVFDATLNCLTGRLDNVNHFISQQVPFYVMGLYYALPISVPLIPYIRNRWRNKPEIYDPDAIEFIDALKKNDDAFLNYLVENPEEENNLLTRFTSYLRHEKNQPFNVQVNLFFLSLRAAHGILILSEGLNLLSKETNDDLNDKATLISSISNILYLSIMILHNNFQKYHFPEKKKEMLKSNLMKTTFFKNKKSFPVFHANLAEPLLPSSDIVSDTANTNRQGLP